MRPTTRTLLGIAVVLVAICLGVLFLVRQGDRAVLLDNDTGFLFTWTEKSPFRDVQAPYNCDTVVVDGRRLSYLHRRESLPSNSIFTPYVTKARLERDVADDFFLRIKPLVMEAMRDAMIQGTAPIPNSRVVVCRLTANSQEIVFELSRDSLPTSARLLSRTVESFCQTFESPGE